MSTAFFELTANIIYVTMMEVAFGLGDGPANVGTLLVIQSLAQLTLAPLVGSIADKLGRRASGLLGLTALASTSLGLTFSGSITAVYWFAYLITVAPARACIIRWTRG